MNATKRKFNALLNGIGNKSTTSLSIEEVNNDTTTTNNATQSKKRRISGSNPTPSEETSSTSTPIITRRLPSTAMGHKKSASTVTSTPTTEAPKYAPWDRTEFLKRLKSFSSLTDWTPKPARVNEVEWAKRGWVCQKFERVRCSLCNVEILVKLNKKEVDGKEEPVYIAQNIEDTLVDKYVGLIVTSHEKNCLWRKRGYSIFKLPLTHAPTTIESLQNRYKEVRNRKDNLPYMFNMRIPSELDLEAMIGYLPKDFFAPSAAAAAAEGGILLPEANKVALMMALCGWQGYTHDRLGPQPGSVSCQACFRVLGLWLFKSKEVDQTGEETMGAVVNCLDVVKEHRDYCPWRNPSSQNGLKAAAASGSSAMAGWQILIRLLKNDYYLRHQSPGARASIQIAPDTTSEAGSSIDENREIENTKIRDEKDKERWARLRRISKHIDFMSRKVFAPHNTSSSQETPAFGDQRIGCASKRAPDSTNPSATTTYSFSEGRFQSPENQQQSHNLSDLGDSSSIFSFKSFQTPPSSSTPGSTKHTSGPLSSPKTPPSFDFTGSVSNLNETDSPIPFVFGASKETSQNKMVNERSPAKAPLRPVMANEQPPRIPDGLASKPPQSAVPQFGQPTLPHSPLHRPVQKDSGLFIQPKSRPEHHREVDKLGNPSLQALKDTTRKAMDPLLPKAPAAYQEQTRYAYSSNTSAPVRAPVPGSAVYTTTQSAPPPTFGSMGSTYGGFSSINTGNNYIDLTRNDYRPTMTVPDPFTWVDPAKAQEDLKALLEGVMEDEDDMPRTRSRRKKKDAETDDLADKLKGLNVEEKLEVDSEEEEEDDGTVEGVKVKLLPHQVEGLDWMRGRELGTGKKGRVPKGGILADDMGLGKTLQSISLILNNPKPTDEDVIAKRKLPSGIEKCTLVVAPLALIRQWELEINDKVESSHSLRVIVHHGPQRTKHFQDLKKYDVVITTYQILVSEFGNSSKDENGLKVGCFGLHWYRVILDEAHTIKNRNAKATQACYALRSEYRWCLTGTPMQNNLDELQSLIKFLRIKPYDDLREFKEQIDRPMKNGRGDVAIKRLRHYLKIFMKRRTKDILTKEGALNPGGKPSAPGEASTTGFKVTERRIEKVFAEFSPEERRFYERLEQRTDASIEQMMSGEKVNYASALVLLLRLRQACNHPKLVAGKLAKDSEALAGDGGATSSQKAKASNADVDDMADMFGAMGMGSKKCEVCQLDLGKQAIADGAIRCLDCEADLKAVSKKHKSQKDKKKHKHTREGKKESETVVRKPRNRAIIRDSDDDDDDEDKDQEGSWVVPKEEQGSLRLGKAGGAADENCEGGGEWLDSDDTFPDLQKLGTMKKPIKLDNSNSESNSDSGSEAGSDSDSDSGSGSEVEDEIQSSDDEEAQLATIVTSTKITHLMKILGKEAAEHKFIVFSQFTSMLDLIEPFLRQKGFKFTRYDGSMKNDLREASLSKLRNDKSCRILLCSLKCGSLGLNLTAATRVVILEPFWNPLKTPSKSEFLISKRKKRELAKQTIEGGKGGAGKLGMKEILQLFRRDAEHAPPAPGAAQYDLAMKAKILKNVSLTNSSASSRDGPISRDRLPSAKPSSTVREDNVYGRRW
ncbi:hypothetical protein G7Y89_g424 [Cudoniella acicularis]|uniref:Uncharacterized protein n=1 Tax=Cudoniella acicularis TaxID=354080 RepID=A0A8H4WAF6_9HELO|nr:hypothetical protein G7Y89_g424 [Cudoniella acicularis]